MHYCNNETVYARTSPTYFISKPDHSANRSEIKKYFSFTIMKLYKETFHSRKCKD